MQGKSTFSRKGDIMEAKSKNKGKEKKKFGKEHSLHTISESEKQQKKDLIAF